MKVFKYFQVNIAINWLDERSEEAEHFVYLLLGGLNPPEASFVVKKIKNTEDEIMVKIGSIFEAKELTLRRTPPWAKKSVTIGTVPWTAKSPTPAQARARLAMIGAGKAAGAATAGLSGPARITAMNAHVSSALGGQSHGGHPPGYKSKKPGYNTEAFLRKRAGQQVAGGMGFALPPPPGF